MRGKEMWFKFTPDSDDVRIVLNFDELDLGGKLDSAVIYKGSCSSMSDTILTSFYSSDTALFISSYNLELEVPYFIKIISKNGLLNERGILDKICYETHSVECNINSNLTDVYIYPGVQIYGQIGAVMGLYAPEFYIMEYYQTGDFCITNFQIGLASVDPISGTIVEGVVGCNENPNSCENNIGICNPILHLYDPNFIDTYGWNLNTNFNVPSNAEVGESVCITINYLNMLGQLICTNTTCLEVQEKPSPAPPEEKICKGECIELTASGAVDGYESSINYLWTNNIDEQEWDTETINVCPDVTTTYTLALSGYYDSQDFSNTGEVTITVVDPKPNLMFMNERCNGQSFAFSNLNLDEDYIYSWDFGDGSSPSAEDNPSHSYSQPGKYVVNVTTDASAKADGCIMETCEPVYVSPTTEEYNEECCSFSYEYDEDFDIEINTNTDWNTNTSIKGTVRVKSGNTLSIATLAGTTIEFGPWGKIIVEPTAELILNERAVLKGLTSCGTMWQGVEVWGNSTENSNTTYQGKITMVTESAIRDAHNAVVLGRFKEPSCTPVFSFLGTPYVLENSGGIIDAEYASFTDNAIGVRFAPYIHSNTSRIERCHFESAALLDPGYYSYNTYTYPNGYNKIYANHNLSQKGYAHVTTWKTRLVRILDNTFEESTYGVAAFDSRNTIIKNTGNGNDFTNHDIAIRSLHTLTPIYYGSTINDNSINNEGGFAGTNHPSGIQISGGKYYQINNNVLNNEADQNNHPQSFIGLVFQNSSSFIVTGNEFKMYRAGVYVEASALHGGWIGPDEGGTANAFSYCQNGSWVQGNNMNLKIRCNNYLNPEGTLYTRNWMVMDQLADQGEVTNTTENDDKKPAGNEFEPENQTARREILSVDNHFIYYRHSQSAAATQSVIPTLATGNVLVATDIYNTGVAKTITSCEAEIPPCCFATGIATGTLMIMDLLEERDLLNAIADEELDPDDLEELLNDHYPLSDEVLTEFIEIYERVPYSNFSAVIRPNQPLSESVYSLLLAAIKELPNETSYGLKYAQTHSDSITVAQIDRSIKHELLERQLLMNYGVQHYIETDSMEFAIALLENDSLAPWNKASKQTLVATYLEDINLTDAQDLLNEFEPENNGDEDWKNLMQMEIDLAIDTLTVFDMDSTQEALVRDIAYEGEISIARVNAQSILTLVYGEEFEIELNEPSGKTDEEEDETLIPAEQIIADKSNVFLLYPNPTSSDIKIDYKIAGTDIAYIEVSRSLCKTTISC